MIFFNHQHYLSCATMPAIITSLALLDEADLIYTDQILRPQMSWNFQIFHDRLASQKFSVESSRTLSFTINTLKKAVNNITNLLAYVSLIWSQGYCSSSQRRVM